jgi:hypothetical protein
MVVKFRNTTWPPPPQLSLQRRAALSSNSNGTRSYIAERSLDCKMSVGSLPGSEPVPLDLRRYLVRRRVLRSFVNT